MRSQKLAFAFAGLSLFALASIVTAGSLTPPAGPVLPTMKTLSDVEPRTPLSQSTAPGDATNQFRITQPGSYYLTGNITGVAARNCISIEANGVTLDLNGFKLEGVAGSLSGIITSANYCTVRNGYVRAFRVGVDGYEAAAIRVLNIASSNHQLECIRASINAVLENCVTEYGTIGFDVFESATLTGCTARRAESAGFEVAGACALTSCAATYGGVGFRITGPGAVLTNCTAQTTQSSGFSIDESAVLTDCAAFSCTSAGFSAVARTRLTRCNSRDNQYGFVLTEANSVVECTASSNSGNGVYIGGNANTVERSTMHENAAAGINIATGAGNNIDGNLLTYNGTAGLFISSASNLAVRNRARGNSTGNYQLHGSTDYGVILTNPGAAFTSSAAWANFAF